MATKVKTTPEQANDYMNQMAVGHDVPISFEDAFDVVEKADSSNMADLTKEYFKFTEKGEYTFLFTGMSKATIDENEVEVVELMDREKRQYINGDTMLVKACSRLTVIPCFIKVNYLSDVKVAKGSYKNLKVNTFVGNIAK